jgi:biotin carboxyl carrier protein
MDNTPFLVQVNETEFTISPEMLSAFDGIKMHNGKFHVLQDKKSYKAEILEVNFDEKVMRIKVNGNCYDVKILDKYDRLVKQIGLTVGGTHKTNSIKSPMPGLVLQIMAEVGQSVIKGETLLILEAMKMENTIKAPADAVIKSIHVAKGSAIDKGQLLIELE